MCDHCDGVWDSTPSQGRAAGKGPLPRTVSIARSSGIPNSRPLSPPPPRPTGLRVRGAGGPPPYVEVPHDQITEFIVERLVEVPPRGAGKPTNPPAAEGSADSGDGGGVGSEENRNALPPPMINPHHN